MKLFLSFFIVSFFNISFLNATDNDALKTQQLSNHETQLISFVKDCIIDAAKGHSKIDNSVLNIEGMSSPKVRHFLNNLCSNRNTSYLEIGVWKGSTFISALYHNEENVIHAIGMENWAEFEGPREEGIQNCKTFISKVNHSLIEADCFTVNKKELFNKPVNVYFYDGNHDQSSQEKAFIYFNDVLDDLFVAVVDDWNFEKVSKGTQEAFEKLHYQVLYEEVMPSYRVNDAQEWWNGLYIAVIRKPAIKSAL